MKELPTYWRDKLKTILLEDGFDAVIEQLEEWFGEEHAGLR